MARRAAAMNLSSLITESTSATGGSGVTGGGGGEVDSVDRRRRTAVRLEEGEVSPRAADGDDRSGSDPSGTEQQSATTSMLSANGVDNTTHSLSDDDDGVAPRQRKGSAGSSTSASAGPPLSVSQSLPSTSASTMMVASSATALLPAGARAASDPVDASKGKPALDKERAASRSAMLLTGESQPRTAVSRLVGATAETRERSKSIESESAGWVAAHRSNSAKSTSMSSSGSGVANTSNASASAVRRIGAGGAGGAGGVASRGQRSMSVADDAAVAMTVLAQTTASSSLSTSSTALALSTGGSSIPMQSQSTRRYMKEREASTSPLRRADSQPRLAPDSDSGREEAAREDKREFLADFLRTRPSAAQVSDKVGGGVPTTRSPPPDPPTTVASADTSHLHISKPTDVQRNRDVIVAMLAAAGVDPADVYGKGVAASAGSVGNESDTSDKQSTPAKRSDSKSTSTTPTSTTTTTVSAAATRTASSATSTMPTRAPPARPLSPLPYNTTTPPSPAAQTRSAFAGARPTASAATALALSGENETAMKGRRLRNVTYLRTTAIQTPILQILSSREYALDVPRYERLMGDEVVFVIAIRATGTAAGVAGWNWLVRHKYSAFANLHLILKGLRIVKELPKFPRKGLVLYISHGTLEKRCEKFGEYLNELRQSPVGTSQTFIDFLRPTMASAYNETTATTTTTTNTPTKSGSAVSSNNLARNASNSSSSSSSNSSNSANSNVSRALSSATATATAAAAVGSRPTAQAPTPQKPLRHKKSSSSSKQAQPPPLPPDSAAVSESVDEMQQSDNDDDNDESTSSSDEPPPPPPAPPPPPPPSLSISSSTTTTAAAAPTLTPALPPIPSTTTTTGTSSGSTTTTTTAADGEAALLREARVEAAELRAVVRPEKLSLDDFEMLRLIGVGGFGKVFVCRKRSTGEILALKRLRKKLIEVKGQATHVRTEKEVLEFTRALGDESWLTRLFYSFETPEYVYVARLCVA